MFCPKCGTNNQEGATFCANCGNSFVQQQQPATPAAFPAAGSQPQGGVVGGIGGVADKVQNGLGGIAGQIQSGMGGAAVKAGGSNTKLILMGVGAIVVIALLVVLIRMFACSAAPLNLNDIVLKDPKDVVGMIDRYEEVKVSGAKVITSNKDFADDMDDGLWVDAKDDKDDAAKLKKYEGQWFMRMLDKKSESIDKDDVKDGDNPAYAVAVTIVVEGDMTCEKMDKILSKWANYDDIILAREKNYISGYFSGDGVTGSVSASRGEDESEDVWVISITVVDDDANESLSESMKYAKKNYDEKDYKELYTKK